MSRRLSALLSLVILTLSASPAFACGPAFNDGELALVILAAFAVALAPYLVANGIALSVMGPSVLGGGWRGVFKRTLVSAIPVTLGLLAGAGMAVLAHDTRVLGDSHIEAALVLTTPAVFSSAYLAWVWSRARRDARETGEEMNT